MKEMTLATLIAVFQEMLGGWFWVLVLLGVAVFVALAVILVRDKRLYAARLIRAEIGGLVGGIFAVWLALAVTNSSLADAGGPIDWLLYGMLFGIGAVGATILAYVALSLTQGLGHKSRA
jgi:hypothetical protein